MPYEESSVYSLVNLTHLDRNSQPVLDSLKGLHQYSVELEPGDVLYVPRHWWHQVVTTSSWSISLNTWLHHPADTTARLGEMLVRWQVANMVSTLGKEARSVLGSIYYQLLILVSRGLILNPNEDDLLDTELEERSELVKHLKRHPTSRESEYFSYKYDGKVEQLIPSPLQTPASSLSKDSERESIFSSPFVAVLNSLTDQNVIAAAVQNILSSDL